MYHEPTYDQLKRRRMWRIVGFAIALAVIVAIFVGASIAQRNAAEQGVVSIRNSVLNTAQQCYAIEGSYPSSLKHLEDKYGLSINHNNYIVYYEWFADNVPPTVTVTAR